jgi:sporulation protein YlmC with PRC-barrel domain
MTDESFGDMTDESFGDMTDDTFDLRLRLLDRQVVDRDGGLICKVDDVELTATDDGGYVVTALLAGPLALGPRLPGRLGRWTVALAKRWSTDPEPAPRRIPFERVTELGSAVVLDRSRDQLGIAPLEDWVRTHVIDRIPGSRHASE